MQANICDHCNKVFPFLMHDALAPALGDQILSVNYVDKKGEYINLIFCDWDCIKAFDPFTPMPERIETLKNAHSESTSS